MEHVRRIEAVVEYFPVRIMAASTMYASDFYGLLSGHAVGKRTKRFLVRRTRIISEDPPFTPPQSPLLLLPADYY